MRKIFKDNAKTNEINRDGFIVIKNFLNSVELENLINKYHAIQEDKEINTTFSSYEGDNLFKRKFINEAIKFAIKRSVNENLINYKPLTGVFISKPKNNINTKIKLHFDSNCIEEENHESVVLWIPLHEVNEQNGALQVFKGSHQFMSKIRPFGAPFCYEKYYDFFEQHFITPICLNAGDALLFFNRTLHFSDINISESERIAFRIDLIPNELNAIQYFYEKGMPKNKVKVFKIDDNYYERFKRDEIPSDDFFDKIIENNFKELSKNNLNKIIGNIDVKWENVLFKYKEPVKNFYYFKKIIKKIFQSSDK